MVSGETNRGRDRDRDRDRKRDRQTEEQRDRDRERADLTRLLMSESQTSWLNTTSVFSMLAEADRESIRCLDVREVIQRTGRKV